VTPNAFLYNEFGMRLVCPAALSIAFCLLRVIDAGAQPPPPAVPVQIGPSGCTTGLIIGLDDPPVRNGPAASYRIVGKRINGQRVSVCGERDGWYAVVYSPSGRTRDCGLPSPGPTETPYRGPCRTGWIDGISVDLP
jgi:hypothetical protein